MKFMLSIHQALVNNTFDTTGTWGAGALRDQTWVGSGPGPGPGLRPALFGCFCGSGSGPGPEVRPGQKFNDVFPTALACIGNSSHHFDKLYICTFGLFVQSNTFVQTLWMRSKTFFQMLWCKARLLFKNFGSEARLLFKHFGC